MNAMKLLLLLPVVFLTGCFGGSSTCEVENEQMKAMLARDREYQRAELEAREEAGRIIAREMREAKGRKPFRLP